MITRFKKIQNSLVFTQDSETPMPIGLFIDLIINSETGNFPAIWIKTPKGLKILLKEDIILWEKDQLLISSTKDLIDPEKLPTKLNSIIKKDEPILDTIVWNRDKKIGKVSDFVFNLEDPRLLKIFIQHNWKFWTQKQIIPFQKIIKITKKGIFINENQIKTKTTANEPI